MKENSFKEIEKKWQERWEKEKIFEVKEDTSKKKCYVLEMFPYPSATGLHMGHAFNFTIGDVYAKFKKLQGFNVMHPMGFDSLGLPAENAAIKEKKHPEEYTNNSIKNFIKQQKRMGIGYDWSRMVNTADSSYYKWDQWIFLKMFEKGLVYQKEAPVNWCNKCETIISNEQAQGGKCERCGSEIEIKIMKQWFIKITEYTDRLLESHKKLNWPEKTIAMQKNWIGKSYGTEIDFEIESENKKTNFILLHGYTGSPKNNFFPWLKKELENRKYKVLVPELPNTKNPDYLEQVKFVLDNLHFDENTILLGHSLGGAVSLKVVESLKKPIKKLILASGFVEPNSKDKKYVNTFDWKFNFDKIRKNVKEIIILKDINDKEIRKNSAKRIKDAIGGEIIEFKAKEQHICGEIEPVVLDSCLNKFSVFTTRPDTIFGVTFMVISAQHPRLMKLVTKEQKKEVEEFLKKLKSVSEKELADMEKEGVFTGSYAINPSNEEKIPIYAGNFVVADYGSGMVMAVPAHDQRDFEFAKKYGIKIKQVITGEVTDKRAYTDSGALINSEKFNSIPNDKAKEEITKWLEEKGKARKVVNYKLRDWSVARQRYWGTPIPLIHCKKCGVVPVPEKDLPVELPKKVTFGKGNPLLTNNKWLKVKCPKCGGEAEREANTMDTFVNSSWYFLRYCDPHNDKEIFSKEKIKYWMPIDMYIGGAEHTCMHLIYCRFYTMFLHDIGLIDFNEPAPRVFHQGMINDEKGEKMSKSKGNVIEPLETIKKYGVDATRFFMMSEASPDKGFNWNDKGIQGSLRMIKKVEETFQNLKINQDSDEMTKKINDTIKEVTEQIENIEHRKATIKLRELFEFLSKQKEASKETIEKSLILLSPFCPHIAEELWEKIGNKKSIFLSKWPEFKETKIKKSEENLDNKIIKYVKETLNKFEKKVNKIYIYVMPFEISSINTNKISKELKKEVFIYSVKDPKKFDPENRSKKALPRKPGIYFE
ncbi:MAG: alpha/beta fold hydrolase [Candidatus Pacearchaeota archaeon]